MPARQAKIARVTAIIAHAIAIIAAAIVQNLRALAIFAHVTAHFAHAIAIIVAHASAHITRKRGIFGWSRGLSERKPLEIEGLPLNTYAGKAAAACRTKLRGIFGDSGFVMLHLMDVVAFMMLHDRLASKGYFITKDNRDEMYIKILETGEPELFDVLEKYIQYLDVMEDLQGKIDVYNGIIEQLRMNRDSDQETINAIVKDYLVN